MAEAVKVVSNHGDEYDMLVGEGGTVDQETFDLWVKGGQVRRANTEPKAEEPSKRGPGRPAKSGS